MRKNIVVLFLLGLIVAFSACDKKYEDGCKKYNSMNNFK